jgi:DNA-binding response OmpR family regulator
VSSQFTRRLLFAEHDDELRRLVTRRLRADGWLVDELRDGNEARQYLLARPSEYALAILDQRMRGHAALDIVSELRTRGVELPIVVTTAVRAELGVAMRGVCVLEKPFDNEELRDVLAIALASGPRLA